MFDYKKSCFDVPIFYLTLKPVHLEKIEVDISLTYVLEMSIIWETNIYLIFTTKNEEDTYLTLIY